jgi:uncharacterized protein YdhG (YjbR/CyaY superfamily)
MLLTASLPVMAAGQHNGAVSAQEIDQYLDALEEPKRATLALLRQMILNLLPEAEQGISYGVPAFRVRGKTIAGFAAFKNHLSYLPHSGSVFPQLRDELKGYATSAGALRFDIGHALPAPLVEKLIAVRLRQAFPDLGSTTATAGAKGTASCSSPGISEQSASDADRRLCLCQEACRWTTSRAQNVQLWSTLSVRCALIAA